MAVNKKRLQEGNAYIREREKLASTSGISSKQAARQMIPDLEQQQKISQDEVTRQKIKEQVEQEKATQEKQKTFIVNPEENKIIGETFPEGSFPNKVAQVFGINEPQRTLKGIFQETGTKIVETAAGVIDAVTSVLSARKQADVQTAEGALQDSLKIINSDIQAVKNGQKSYSEARVGFEQAINSISNLESSQKGLGQANLRYWLGGGKEIETEIIAYKVILENLDQELLAAREQSLLLQAGITT